MVGRPNQLTHGGSIRAAYLFQALVNRTAALSIYRPDHRAAPAMLRRPTSLLPGAHVAAAEFLPTTTVPFLRRLMRLRAVDVHDHPVLHPAALGMPLTGAQARDQELLMTANLKAFERIIVVSETMGDLVGVADERRIVIGNGTDSRLITPGPWPERPTVGLVSEAAPGRGIERLVDAIHALRGEIPDIILRLCLSAHDAAGRGYLSAMRADLPPWVETTSVPYARLTAFLAGTTILVVPHPPGPSWDAAPTIKLFDYLAAGRPVVVTPRFEMARVVRTAGVGLVADGDAPEDLASAIRALLVDQNAATRMGGLARTAAEERYDWRLLSSRLADEILAA